MIFVAVSTGHFDALIKQCESLHLQKKYEFFGQIGCSHVNPTFPYFRVGSSEEIESKMKEAQLVVSHAGTGMLSMLYRLKKPHVIVPKQIRYGEANDGQVELAIRWAQSGIGVLCLNVEDLQNAIETVLHSQNQFAHFPSLGAKINETLGW